MEHNQTNAFEGALANIGLRYWEYDIKTKRLYRSALVQDEVGYKAYQENVPESFVENGIIHPDYAQPYLDLYHNLAKGIDGRLVFKSLYGNNTWGWLDISYKVIFDENGCPMKAVGVGGDVTKEKQKELLTSHTKSENELLRNVLLTSAAYEFDFLSYINKNTETFITYSSLTDENVRIGEHFSEALQKRLLDANVQNYEVVAKQLQFDVISKALEKTECYMIPLVLEEGKNTYKNKLSKFFNVRGNQQYILMTIQDVTDIQLMEEKQKEELRKAKEEAETANCAKTAFLSNISHDIRTPLNAIINLNELVKTELDNPKQAIKDLEKISISSEFLLSLINDILDISKVESRDTNLTNSLYPFEEFKQYLESVIIPLCDQRNVQFHFNLRQSTEMIITDRVRFNQIFFNLLSNAIKYNDDGGNVFVSSEMIWKKDQKAAIKYLIEDDGIGMSEEFQKRLFQPFAREDTTGTYSGTGLGMNIIKSIIDKMGGEIHVESQKNVGTKVEVLLTLDIPDEAQKEEYRQMKANDPAVQQQSLDIIGHGKHILIAEDHPLNQEILKRLLGKYGIVPECVANGKLAVDCFVNHMPNYYDAILMDIQMPVMSGLDATRKIRGSKKPDAKNIPIVAMTGNAFEEDIQKAKEAGISRYLTKPVEPAKLVDTLAIVLSNKK